MCTALRMGGGRKGGPGMSEHTDWLIVLAPHSSVFCYVMPVKQI